MIFEESVEERSGWLGAVTAKHVDIQQMQRIEIDRRVQPVLVGPDLDSGLIDRDPRRIHRRWVRLAVGHRCVHCQIA